MKRLLFKAINRIKAVLCVLLAFTLVTGCLCAEGLAVTASGQERTFDIGVNPESVTATLSENGLLTVSGSGEIRDFTPETAPFAGCHITAVKLGADIKAVGSYTFYNCGEIRNPITLPKGLIRIGDKAFSGDSVEKAPAPSFVENLFTELTVARKKTEAASSPDAEPSPSTEPVPEAVQEETSASETEAVSEPEALTEQEPSGLTETLEEGGMQAVEQGKAASGPEENADASSEEEPASQPEPVETAEPGPPVEAEDSGNKYLIETITQQEIGTEIFYPRTGRPAFVCSAENESFRAALTSLGYKEAEKVISAAFDCGEGVSAEGGAVVKNVPVVDGKAILPGALEEFSAPEGGALFAYTFGGWTESRDSAGAVRPAGSAFPANDREDLYFIANWDRELLVKITVKRDGGSLVLAVPGIEGYDLTAFRWQSCVLPAGAAIPANQELLSWEDIPGETAQTCRQDLETEKGVSLFRCIVTVKKQQNFLAALFSGETGEELALAAVSGEEAITKVALTAPRAENGEQAVVTEIVRLPTSSFATVYKITSVQITGDFSLVLPTETDDTMALPAFAEGQSAGNTFALRVQPVSGDESTGWEGIEASGSDWGAYVLTRLPAGETGWSSGTEGVWKRGSSYPATASSGAGAGAEGEVAFSLVYDASYKDFSGGQVELTFQEFLQDDSTDEAPQNTVVVRLALEGDRTGMVQSAAIARGRSFSDISSAEKVVITPRSAVTASFLTEYQPVATGAENSYLCLYQVTGEAVSPAVFPAGTKLVLGDMALPGEYRYYFCQAESGEEKISLSRFTGSNAGGSTVYPGPADITSRVSEKLLFAVDFSGAAEGAELSQGEYFLALEHGTGQQSESEAKAKAEFSVTEEGSRSLDFAVNEAVTTGTVWGVKMAPHVPEADTRYADGVCIQVSLLRSDGQAIDFPSQAVITGSMGNAVQNRDGTVSLTMPVNGSYAAAFDFSTVPETVLSAGEYQLKAVMRPRAGLQVGSSQGDPGASSEPLSFTLVPAAVEEGQRSISVGLNADSQRLLDVSEGPAELRLDLEYRGTQSGDKVKVDILKKTGDAPDDSSYTVMEASGWTLSPQPGELSGSGETLTVTIPKGQEKGTYRVKVSIVNSSGSIVAEEPYNFIVK